jgi:hypothetical protein
MTRLPRRITVATVALAALQVGCTVQSNERATAGADSLAADSAVIGAGSPTDAPGVNVDANRTPPSKDSARADAGASATGSSSATGNSSASTGVNFTGVAPLRIGMTAAQARQALGMPASSAKSGECSYLDTKGRMHAFAMLVRDTVARIDVRDNTLATDAGVRVGDAESRVRELYRGRVKTEPHKYVQGGHYLIVTSPTDTTRQIVFETDGKRVTSFRVGRTPEVGWVEGCA